MKTECLNFSCPLCGTKYEIFLNEIPYLMIISCPHCKESLTCYEGKVHIIDDEIVDGIRDATTLGDVKTAIIRFNAIKQTKDGQLISDDDLTNLSIDLSLCNTVDDILKMMED